MSRYFALLLLLPLLACQRLNDVGKAPDFTPVETTSEYAAMSQPVMPEANFLSKSSEEASLWSGGRGSLLGDRRASTQGDILTVVIEINEKAEISNATARAQTGSTTMGVTSLFGIPERLNNSLPDGASMGNAVDTSSNSSFNGNGTVKRNEKLTLRVAATVLETLPNGVLRIQGSQEVRVNYEVRELIVTGYVRPEDVSRQNEITYDKIAGARISYGGRGQISDVQQPRIGQQITEAILPF